jgi:DtxR family Mn-dependent transcriptional regulator
MRKHRLAECLLVQVIGLDWELVHEEACRWEHVMSETVERRLLDVLGHPTVSPYGNPIPGLDELGEDDSGVDPINGVAGLVTLDRVSIDAGAAVWSAGSPNRCRATPPHVAAAPGRRTARPVDHCRDVGGWAARRVRRRDHRDLGRDRVARLRHSTVKGSRACEASRSTS